MAKGKKTGGRDWQKGGPTPFMRKPVAPELQRLKVESKEAVAKLFWNLLHLTQHEVEEKLSKASASRTTMFELGILHALVKDTQKGKIDCLKMMKETVIGRPKEIIELSGAVKIDKTVDVSKLTDVELEILLAMMSKASLSGSQNT